MMISDDLETGDLDDLTTDALLKGDREFTDRLIFTADVSFGRFEFFGFLDHLLSDSPELTTFMGEYVCLIFVGLDFFFKATILTILILDPSLDLLDGVMIVPHELFDLASVDVEIEDPISETIQELGIMRYHEYRSLIVLEK